MPNWYEYFPKLFTAVALALAVVLGGCAGADSQKPQPAVKWTLPDKPEPAVRGKVRSLYSEGENVRAAAVEELIRRCMVRHGFDYVKRPATDGVIHPIMGDKPDYKISVDDAKTSGYETAEKLRDTPQDEDPAGFRKMSKEERRKWGEVFFGTNVPMVKVKIPTGGEVWQSKEGCLAEAERKIYGLLEDMIRLKHFAGDLPLVCENAYPQIPGGVG